LREGTVTFKESGGIKIFMAIKRSEERIPQMNRVLRTLLFDRRFIAWVINHSVQRKLSCGDHAMIAVIGENDFNNASLCELTAESSGFFLFFGIAAGETPRGSRKA
jgi:hypothetical protein